MKPKILNPKILLLLCLCVSAVKAHATITFDLATEGTGTTTFSWTHTTSEAPEGVFVFINENVGVTDVISGVTYGGDIMTRIDLAVDGAGEPGSLYAYFLGTSIPTGNQTVQITVSSGTTDKHAVCITVNAVGDTQLAGTTGTCKVQGDAENPSCDITGITGASYSAAGLFSGLNSEVNVTAGAEMTLGPSFDYGTKTGHSEYETTQQASGNQTVAFTSGIDDVAMVAIAIEQVTPDAPPTRSRAVMIE